jgi:hypothetical protein
MAQLYIEYLYPGSMFSESSYEKVNSRETPSNFPERAFAFRFTEREEVLTADGETLKGSFKNNSGWKYIGGTEKTLEQVEREHPEKRILIANLKNNEYSRCVFTKFGQVMPLEDEDVVLKIN